MKDKLAGKRKALAPLVLELKLKELQLLNNPEFAPAMADRQQHIERGELWVTPQAANLAPLFMEIAVLRNRIDAIRATPARLFRHSGKLDKRKMKRRNKKATFLSVNMGKPSQILTIDA